FAI
ncbi:tcdB toxin N-terminal helical domain protein, partial [Chlamydia psittaci 02DC14]